MPVKSGTSTEILARSTELQSYWSTRNRKMVEWYKMLLLEDRLSRKKMESAVSNRPRTFFNLSRHLLTPDIITHAVPTVGMTPTEVTATSELEEAVGKIWKGFEVRNRFRGKQSFMSQLVGFILATGWYAVWCNADDESFQAEVWNPYETFPAFSDDGMLECVHIYTLTKAQAEYKAAAKGWNVMAAENMKLVDYWIEESPGNVYNSIHLGYTLVKPLTSEPKFGRIPVFTGPVGGLPDMGSIVQRNWQEHFGESILSTNERVYEDFNKYLTFMMQSVRDAVQASYLERSQSGKVVPDPEKLFAHGSLFKGGIQDSVVPVERPPIPVELRQLLFEYSNMIQEGSFSSAMFGNIQQKIQGYVLSQMAQSAVQSLKPYHTAVKGLLSDIDNFWMGLVLEKGYRPKGFTVPKNLPEVFSFEVEYPISIPGDIINRATVARMLDPNFRLSTNTVTELLFPEIQNPLMEMARVNKDDVMADPVSKIPIAIKAFKEFADEASNAGDGELAGYYNSVVEYFSNKLKAGGQQPQQSGGGKQITPSDAVQSRQARRGGM